MPLATVIRIALAGFLVFAAGCGGGGGGTEDGSGTTPPPTPPTTPTTPAKLDADTANSVAEVFMLQLQLVHQLRSHVPHAYDSDTVAVTRYGWHGGSFSIDGVIDPEATESILDVDFAGFSVPGMLFDARLVIDGRGSLHIPESDDPVLELHDVTVSNGYEDFSVNGNVTLRGTQASADLSVQTSEASWSGQLVVDSTLDTASYQTSVSTSGRINLADAGYFDVTTDLPVEVPTLLGGAYGGSLVAEDGIFSLSGEDSARLKIDLSDGRIGTVKFDSDGNGSIDKARRFTWSNPDIDWSADAVRGFPIAVARFPYTPAESQPPQIDEPQVLDAALSIGAPGEWLSFSWDIWQKPAGSSVTLENADSASPGFTPDVPGYYVFALRAEAAQGHAIDLINVNIAGDGTTVWGVTQTSLGSNFSASPGDLVKIAHPLKKEYSWHLRTPPDSNAVLGDPHAPTTEFVPDVAGVYAVHNLRIVVGDPLFYSQPFISNTRVISILDVDGDGEDDQIVQNSGVAWRELIYASDPQNPRLLQNVPYTTWQDLDGNGTLEAVGLRSPDVYDPSGPWVQVHHVGADGNILTAGALLPYVDGNAMPGAAPARLPDGTALIFASTPYDAQTHHEWRWTGTALEETALIADPAPFAHNYIQLDYDGDDLLDVVSYAFVNNHVDELALWRGKADNTFEYITDIQVETLSGIKALDLDGNGRDELLVTHADDVTRTDETNGLYLHADLSGAGFTDSVRLYSLYRMSDLQARDFNGDGRLDLAFSAHRQFAGPEAVLLYQSGDGSFTEKKTYPLDTYKDSPWEYLNWQDVNNDGLLDLLYAGMVSFGMEMQ